MPKGIYKRKPRAGMYAPGKVINTPTGDVVVLEYFPRDKATGRNSRAVVRFLATGYTVNVQTSNLKAGKVADKLAPSVYGVGYLGTNIRIPQRGHYIRRVYDLWANMLKRCYGPYAGQYEDARVDTRWHSFKTFLDTIIDVPGYSSWEAGEDVHLDKDIKIPGNRVYSRDNCLFVPSEINISDSALRRWAKK